jgi:tRNA(fMet)-specific endonuclease VapC
MSFLLDTNILSAHLRRPSGLAHYFFQYSGRLYTTSIALAELFVWAYNRPDPQKTLTAIDELVFQEVRVLDYDRDCANEFGQVRVQLRRSGIEVPSLDLMIASVALVYDVTLVTHNTADFENIPGQPPRPGRAASVAVQRHPDRGLRQQG